MFIRGFQPCYRAFVILTSLFTFAVVSSCSSQDPAFKEDVTTTRTGNGDLTKVGASGEADAMENGLADTESGLDGDGATMNDGGAADSSSVGDGGGEVDSGTADGSGSDGSGSDGTADVGLGIDGGTGSGGSDGGMDAGSDGGLGGGPKTTYVPRTVSAIQKGPGKVDILWIIDSSGSMSEEQTYLGNNFSSFINQLVTAGHDFQTAVTSTDVCQDTIPADLALRVCPVNYGGSAATRLRGSFVGETGRKVLKNTDTDIVSRFTDYTKVGISGSGFEHGLKAAQMSIEKVTNGENDPLIRADAFLAVIVVSDEEDDGIGLSLLDPGNNRNFHAEGLTTFKYTEDNMIDYLKVVKGEGKFSVSAIAPTRGADGEICTSAHSRPNEEGTQYIKAAQKTGGIIQSICDTNWSASLAQIGYDLNAQLTQIVLTSRPEAGSIKVMVNDVSVTTWTYNEGNNAVKFDPGNVPAAGSRIQIDYLEAVTN